MHAILVHGMGRSSLSMAWLGLRLRLARHSVSYFSYSAAQEEFACCVSRLRKQIQACTKNKEYIVVGHSLGTVLLRCALADQAHQPRATFLLAPPTQACAMAKRLSGWRLYRWLTGEMGQLLASADFMRRLPAPPKNAVIFAGCSGPRLHLLPYGVQANDGILAVDETRLPGFETHVVPSIHTLIMNHPSVMQTICAARAEA